MVLLFWFAAPPPIEPYGLFVEMERLDGTCGL